LRSKTILKQPPITIDTAFYKQGIGKLIPLNNKCIKCGGDYVRKYWDGSRLETPTSFDPCAIIIKAKVHEIIFHKTMFYARVT